MVMMIWYWKYMGMSSGGPTVGEAVALRGVLSNQVQARSGTVAGRAPMRCQPCGLRAEAAGGPGARDSTPRTPPRGQGVWGSRQVFGTLGLRPIGTVGCEWSAWKAAAAPLV